MGQNFPTPVVLFLFLFSFLFSFTSPLYYFHVGVWLILVSSVVFFFSFSLAYASISICSSLSLPVIPLLFSVLQSWTNYPVFCVSVSLCISSCFISLMLRFWFMGSIMERRWRIALFLFLSFYFWLDVEWIWYGMSYLRITYFMPFYFRTFLYYFPVKQFLHEGIEHSFHCTVMIRNNSTNLWLVVSQPPPTRIIPPAPNKTHIE